MRVSFSFFYRLFGAEITSDRDSWTWRKKSSRSLSRCPLFSLREKRPCNFNISALNDFQRRRGTSNRGHGGQREQITRGLVVATLFTFTTRQNNKFEITSDERGCTASFSSYESFRLYMYIKKNIAIEFIIPRGQSTTRQDPWRNSSSTLRRATSGAPSCFADVFRIARDLVSDAVVNSFTRKRRRRDLLSAGTR